MNFLTLILVSIFAVILAVFLLFVVTGWAWMQFGAMVDETNDAIARSNQICEEGRDER